MKKYCPKRHSLKSSAHKRSSCRRLSKHWLDAVKCSPLNLLASGSGFVLLADWGEQSGLTPGSDGTPGYSIYRGPQQSTETAGGITLTGWNVIVQWEMNIGYLNSLSCPPGGGVVGKIHQNVYREMFNLDDESLGSNQEKDEDFDVYCTLIPIYHNGVILTYNRSYNIPKDIYLIPDSDITQPPPDGISYVVEWGEAYFVADGGSSQDGGTVSRWLAIEKYDSEG